MELPTFQGLINKLYIYFQQEARLERKEERMHNRAVNAALHGNIGKAVHLEVCSMIWWD